MSDNQPSGHQEDPLTDSAAADCETSTVPDTKEQEETDADKSENIKPEQQETEGQEGGESDGEEGKGVKRKREETHREEEVGQSTEKKKVSIHG